MPYKTRRFKRRGRRPAYTGLATRPRMMGRNTAISRKHGIDTKTFWFKENGILTTAPSPNWYRTWITHDITGVGAPASFNALARLYDQYKVLGMKVRLIPANPQVDLNPTTGALLGIFALRRGNIAMWSDQRYDPTMPIPNLIGEVIGNNNTRIINPARRTSQSVYRPKGKYSWGSTKQAATAGDPWQAEINMLVNDASPTPTTGPVQMYYYTRQWKVIFRGRVDD